MARGEHQTVLRDERQHFFHFRKQFAITSDTHEWPVLFGVPNLILCIECRHPNEPPPSSRDLGHVCHSRGIYSANREVEVDSAEHFQTGYLLPDQVGQSTRRIIVVLQDDSAHTLRMSKLGHIERVNGPGPAVRIAVNVDIDRPGEDSVRIVRTSLLSSSYRCC